jgi:tetratricopeptide (TPR) repeat protein
MKRRPPIRNKTSNSSSLLQLALRLHQLGKLDQAESLSKAVLETQPDNFEALHLQGICQFQQGRNDEAERSLRAAVRVAPTRADAWSDFGVVQATMGRLEEAVASYDKAIALKPNHFDALSNRGNALMALKRPDDALASYDRALATNPRSANALNNRGVTLFELCREEEALASYDKAIGLKPDYATAHDNKGLALLRLGRVEEAGAAFEAAMKLAPKMARSYYHFMLSKRFERGDPRLRTLEELALGNSLPDVNEAIYAHFALGKALAGVEDYERSFHHLSQGNALKRKQSGYDEANVLGNLERWRATCTSEFLGRHYGCGDPSAVPVFVVGMPRSGTSLVEQILASHHDVYGAGETKDFALAMTEVGAAGLALFHPEVVPKMSGEEFRRLGTKYLQRIQAAAPSASRIVNKLPDNFRFVGLIALALPNARFIHVRRDPVDTCVSCFSTLFAENMPYTHDLTELGRYYRAYETLMNFWRDVLPQGMMIDVQYEDVVADIEGQGRRIYDHCGLEWDAHCLKFHHNARTVRTASAAQVRRPLYNNSVGRWRRYEACLGLLLAALGPSIAPADRPQSPTDEPSSSALAA